MYTFDQACDWIYLNDSTAEWDACLLHESLTSSEAALSAGLDCVISVSMVADIFGHSRECVVQRVLAFAVQALKSAREVRHDRA